MGWAACEMPPGEAMEIDAWGVRDGSQLEADLCIIGAGPAGLTIAREFIGRDLRVALLESGGNQPDPDIRALCSGTTAGDPYADPRLTRHRQAGGTANEWNTAIGSEIGAKYVSLDPVDFEERPWLPWSGWPFGKAHLDPYYERAHGVCGLGPCTYRAAGWADPERPALPLGGGLLTTGLYRYGLARPFTRTHLNEIRLAGNTTLYLHAAVVELATDPVGQTVTHARVKCLTGTGFSVRAPLFVLAAGGIENARLLLLSTGARRDGLGNEHGLVGRCFMDHPRDSSCALIPRDPTLFEHAGFYDVHSTPRGIVMGRLTLTNNGMRREQLLNMSATLTPRPRGYRSPGMEALRAVRVASLRRPRELVRQVHRLAAGLGDVMGYAYRRQMLGYHPVNTEWSLLPDKTRRFATFELLLNLEQAPDPDNRVMLGPERDALGQLKAHIVWRWRERDQRNLDRVRAILARELEQAGIGRVILIPGATLDSNAHHHLGATRMHRDPRRGVVDENSRVHSTSNLFVAGSSVFPTGGYANPTLTIVALALRLADHLKRNPQSRPPKLGTSSGTPFPK